VKHLERCAVKIELGPLERFGAKGPGTSVYFRDPDGSLLEFISMRTTRSKALRTDSFPFSESDTAGVAHERPA
jgi:hypothetical protein